MDWSLPKTCWRQKLVKISGSWIKQFYKLGINSTRRLNKEQFSVLPRNNERTIQQIAYFLASYFRRWKEFNGAENNWGISLPGILLDGLWTNSRYVQGIHRLRSVYFHGVTTAKSILRLILARKAKRKREKKQKREKRRQRNISSLRIFLTLTLRNKQFTLDWLSTS